MTDARAYAKIVLPSPARFKRILSAFADVERGIALAIGFWLVDRSRRDAAPQAPPTHDPPRG